MLEQIKTKDGWYTPGINGIESTQWDDIQTNVLTLDLGDLSTAPNVKLVITAMVDWGLASTYYDYLDTFKTAAANGEVPDGTEIMPAPYMEIQAADGSWILAPQDRQIPIPSDYNARTFAVDLTGLFPENVSDYKVRFTNFWNVTYDYIGIDTTENQAISTQILKPTQATLGQWWGRHKLHLYRRLHTLRRRNRLMQDTDDIFVVGRQCDAVHMQFSTENLNDTRRWNGPRLHLCVACWFKDPPGEWGYGFTWTVDPMPFLGMTGYPYTDTEHYPTDEAHQQYISTYNTRIIT